MIIHEGTNELDSERQNRLTTKSIIDVAKNIKANVYTVSISGIVPRNNDFNNKALDIRTFKNVKRG